LRRPGTGLFLLLRIVVMAAIGVAIILFVVPTHGLILIPLAPSSSPFAITAGDDIDLRTSADHDGGRRDRRRLDLGGVRGGRRNPLGPVCLRIPATNCSPSRVETAAASSNSCDRTVRAFPLSISRVGDRVRFQRAIDDAAYVRSISAAVEWGVLPVAV
jgi:hypothetical protein